MRVNLALFTGDDVNSTFADYLDGLEGLLSVNQVCELLGVHHDTLYRWVRAKEIPVLNLGKTKPLLRFPPRDLAVWVRETPCFFHGPARFITAWMEEQVLRRGGPRLRPPLLSKVLELTGYDWMTAARRIASDPSLSFSVFHLMDDFSEAVKKLPIGDQRQLFSDIKSGTSDEQTFPVEDAE